MLYTFILKLVGDPALADDLAQETLLRAHKDAASFRGEANRQTWLCSIGLNVVRDHFRAAARQPETMAAPRLVAQIPSTEDLEQALMQAEMSACIGKVLARLPRPQYEVVALYDKAGLTHREIAVLLDITPANSRVLLHRARASLRNLLSERCRLSFDETVPCEPLPGPRSDQGAT